jgi:hypothetical protein
MFIYQEMLSAPNYRAVLRQITERNSKKILKILHIASGGYLPSVMTGQAGVS